MRGRSKSRTPGSVSSSACLTWHVEPLAHEVWLISQEIYKDKVYDLLAPPTQVRVGVDGVLARLLIDTAPRSADRDRADGSRSGCWRQRRAVARPRAVLPRL